MGSLIDITGYRFGRLVVLSREGSDKDHHATWQCLCDCGNTLTVSGHSLRSGNTRSCGCLMRDTSARIAQENARHNGSHSRLYAVWNSMRQRCSNPKHKYFRIYGGRGIKVCDEWANDFERFRSWALSSGYDPEAKRGQCTIDRIDGDGDYCPGNCRWVSVKVQNNNRHKKGWLNDADHIGQNSWTD